jgi:CxxC motif-containing protein (DUF1111 family)
MSNATAMPGNALLRPWKLIPCRFVWGGMAVLIAGAAFGPALFAGGDPGKKADAKAVALGRTLFEREWQPGDSRTHGGDGLGPVYNDSSCVACHNQGGSGGAGSNGKNVDIITATPVGQSFEVPMEQPERPRGFLEKALRSLIGLDKPAPVAVPAPAPGKAAGAGQAARPARPKIDTTELVKAHPGFRTARSIVLHHFSTDASYEQWRQGFFGIPGITQVQSALGSDNMAFAQLAMNFDAIAIQNQIGPFAISRSQRNPTALFGAGLIDGITDADIEAAAKVKHAGFTEIAGRVSRLKDKRIGRFGWKSQTSSLSDFVLTACAVELGLEVPDHHQGGSPAHPEARPKGLDLNAEECASLVAYVADLPRPSQRKPETDREANEIEAGRAVFAKTGCATCHTPKLGAVDGLYSDLLLHDLGPALGDVGQYGVFDPSSSEEEIVDDPASVAQGASPLAPPQEIPGFASTSVETVSARVIPDGAAPMPATAPPSQSRSVVGSAAPAPGTAPPAVAPGSAPEPPVAVAVQRSPFDSPAGGGMAASGMHQMGVPVFKRPTSGPASRFEWRTPPLWGFRDSAPYLHDGRARTLEQAVVMHGGESTRVTQKFFKLKAKERGQLEAFLKSLAAPEPAKLVATNS